MFALIQGRISLAHHPPRQAVQAHGSRMLQRADTEAGGDRNLLWCDVKMRGTDALTQPARDETRLLGAGIWKYYGKLLAAEPGDPIITQPEVAADPGGKLFQDLVASLVAVAIVDEFEMIDVTHHERERPAEP